MPAWSVAMWTRMRRLLQKDDGRVGSVYGRPHPASCSRGGPAQINATDRSGSRTGMGSGSPLAEERKPSPVKWPLRARKS